MSIDARQVSEDSEQLIAGGDAIVAAPRRPRSRLVSLLIRRRRTVALYLAVRVLLVAVGLVNVPLHHGWSLERQLSNWDGLWYLRVVTRWFPHHVSHFQTTLGFFPLYPASMWLVEHVLFCGFTVAGLLIAGVGGLVATLLVEQLALDWWGPAGARRSVIFFCLFPGAVVFSMVYSEGILIPLVAACLLALARRRWVLAGVLAGLATAVGPDAIPLILVCALACARELRSSGWRNGRRSLVAPVLAPVGLVGFAAFLWAWTGTPFASFIAQRDGWGERTDWLALVRQGQTLAHEISFTHFHSHAINLNLVVGLLGLIVLVPGLVLVWKAKQLPPEAKLWVYGVAVLTVTSEYVPPNPRLLITGFPLLMVIAQRFTRRGFSQMIVLSTVLLVVLSSITYVGIALRP